MPGIAGAVGGILGGIAGGQADQVSQTSSVNLRPPSELETLAGTQGVQQLTEIQGLVGAGAGQQDVTAGLESQRDLASLLEQLQGTSGLPTQQDITAARGFTSDIFAPERQQITSGFAEQEQRTAQLAAQLGRPVNDPILQARLASAQQRELGQLGARETQFAAQQAQALPSQRLGFAQSLAGVRQGLASQAFANRQTLFGLGQQALSGEQSFRSQTASRTTTQESGGGLGGAIGGAFAGIGGGLGLLSKFGGLSTGRTAPLVGVNINRGPNFRSGE